MELYRYKATLWDETAKNEVTVYGVAAGETPADAFQRIYDHYFDMVMNINIEFDEVNNGVIEFGFDENAEKAWKQIGEY